MKDKAEIECDDSRNHPDRRIFDVRRLLLGTLALPYDPLQRRGVPRGSGLLVPYDNYTHMGVYYKLKLPYMGTH